ncbi:adenylate/guanylate cyclase domain-containing protein [Nocardioides marmoriginsengisoli]|uniref:Adenylate/guanylate cyclase domain-containing protein n=1 Tax=Nocardioides marmoriginsengisoli TaxID=661483 RepID=A0A3N0CIF8_9ACTN|nr:adenylate/guanylate cyclase domain-containing protein [Nocardioides marmoriginsengisoli]RNL63224.1 adenylate/guanylate cyclase domain-containing protein [Nocardioides marmoriginsengisoli]
MDVVSLDRHGPLGRFEAPIESDYRRWLELHLVPLVVALGGTSVIAWLAASPSALLLAPGDVDLSVVVIVCWCVNVPVLVAGLTWVRYSGGRYVVEFATFGIALTTVDSILLLGPAINADRMTYLGAGMFYGILAPLVQCPFRHSVGLAVLVFTLALWRGLAEPLGSTSPVAATAIYVTLGISVLMIGPAMAWVSERGLRASYAAERTIEHQRALIRRYAPSSVVSRIEHGDSSVDQPQRRRITVLSSDVVGFTAMADRIDPEALALIINDYLGSVSDLIEGHGGTVTEFAGDGVMAIFGAPEEIDPVDQVRSAIHAARELQASLSDWSRSWYEHGIVEPTSARIGINTGVVSVGTFGSAIRATYTGIGLQMNIAARVQAQAEPGGILLSSTSWHLVKDLLACSSRGEVMVKGVHFPIALYEPAP